MAKTSEFGSYTWKRDGTTWDRRVLTMGVGASGKDAPTPRIQSDGWKMHLIQLQTPIFVDPKLKTIIELDEMRIYPPFEIDQASNSATCFTGAKIPNGKKPAVKFGSPWTKSPSFSFGEGSLVCYGMRVDLTRNHDPAWDGLSQILTLLRERSLQWWINSSQNPFDLGSRLVAILNEQGSFPSSTKIDDKEHSPWIAQIKSQMPFGWENVVDEGCWGGFGLALKEGKSPETATTAYLDGITAYMSKMDIDCVYRLCVALEIMEKKVRIAEGRPTKHYALKLLRNAALWEQKDRGILTRIFADRGNIAHGSTAHFMSRNTSNIVDYLELATKYYKKYLNFATDFGWNKLSELQ